ncbi:MAG: erythromycin esterase family protein [Luteibaculaceae bacterium]
MKNELFLALMVVIFSISISNAQESFIRKFENIKDKKIIAVGESAHAQQDFASWNINFFKELVDNEITKVFSLENDYSNSKRLNEFIQGGYEAESLDSLIKNNLYGVWQSKAMKDFLLWAREYNKSKPDNIKIKFFGFDSQCGRCAMKEIMKFMDEEKPDLKKELSSDGLNLLSQIYATSDYNLKKLPKEDRQLMEQTLNRLNELFKEKVNSSHKIQIDLLALNHAWEFENATLLNFTNVRDKNMAIIFEEIIKSQSTPIFMWAHNGHISKSNNSFYKPIGYHLYNNYKSDYLSIALDFKSKINSKTFTDIEDKNWLANDTDFGGNNIKIIKTNSLGKATIRDVGASQHKFKLKNDKQFDYIVYFKEIKN